MLVGGTQIKLQALKIANELLVKDLKFSDGWLHRFKGRHGLVFRKAQGEAT